MPAKHKFKCLNDNCNVRMFVSMTAPTPVCPKCRGIKTEDYGTTTYDLGYHQTSSFGIGTGVLKQSDANLRRIADRYGLTDMSNKDGQAVKRPPKQQSTGEKVKLAGYEVPADAAGSCHRLGVTSKLKGPQIQEVNPNISPMLKQNTRVVAEHKGKI